MSRNDPPIQKNRLSDYFSQFCDTGFPQLCDTRRLQSDDTGPRISKKKKIASMTKNLKEAGEDVKANEYGTPRINDLLHRGVVYKDKKKKYWADAKSQNCFEIYPRGLHIDNSDKSEYWQWTPDREGIETAKVEKTMWLGVRGSFRTENLSQRASYKVSFQLKTTPSSTMAGKTVNLRMTLPNGTNLERPAQLPAVSSDDGQWHELEVGQFCMSAQNEGELGFAMEQLFESWETGLVIKSVEIKAM